ncbi:RNA methyltransferase, TrmH family, group 3 [Sphaceloma murrayae]|uniref:rRNA methyltransferase 1, mitochondrial n=1 Tax=Sphaceloma murrayae TaxID=2082308 RepID=A0A2K1QVP9_9PEZI|nr:RNA methyltransferase, TrmH family, group 3 [Sphaceloma murrayae]
MAEAREKRSRYRDADTGNSRSAPDQRASRTPRERYVHQGDASRRSQPQPENPFGDPQRSSREPRDITLEDDSYGDFAVPTLQRASAASEFIYGRSAAFAVLQAGRRKIYSAYINKSRLEESGSLSTILELCSKRNIEPRDMQTAGEKRMMDSVASDRPHNGIVLDVSPIPYLPVRALGEVKSDKSDAIITTLQKAPQSAEEEVVNSVIRHLTTKSPWRCPFILLLDGIRDEGNLGNIIRTAHFYGVDGIAVCTDGTASVNSSIVAKAASGAIEAVPFLAIKNPKTFVQESRSNGWEVWASIAPDEGAKTIKPEDRRRMFAKTWFETRENPTLTTDMLSPLVERPCILMLGAEGDGLSNVMSRRADKMVTIGRPEASATDVGVDSLNVGSAAAVLVEAFMKKPAELDAAKVLVRRKHLKGMDWTAENSPNMRMKKFTVEG